MKLLTCCSFKGGAGKTTARAGSANLNRSVSGVSA
ncbi:hypothetical protein [Bradyrhizobium algeriense]